MSLSGQPLRKYVTVMFNSMVPHSFACNSRRFVFLSSRKYRASNENTRNPLARSYITTFNECFKCIRVRIHSKRKISVKYTRPTISDCIQWIDLDFTSERNPNNTHTKFIVCNQLSRLQLFFFTLHNYSWILNDNVQHNLIASKTLWQQNTFLAISGWHSSWF